MSQSRDRRRRAEFEQLYADYHRCVEAYVRRRADEALVHDVVSETFLTAWRRSDEAVARGLPWLYRTAGLILSNQQRSFRRQLRVAERIATFPAEEAPDVASGVAERRTVLGALQRLNETDQEVLLLFCWEGLKIREIAEALGCPAGTAAVRLHRAKRRLRAALHAGALTVPVPKPRAPGVRT